MFTFLIFSSCNLVPNRKKEPIDDSLKYSLKKLKDFLSHETITKKMILKEPDSTLEDLIYSNIYATIGSKLPYESTDDEYKNEFYKLSISQQIFTSTILAERTVSFEGFKYYFENNFQAAGQFSDEASKGYQILGFPELSQLIDSATNIFKTTSKKINLELKKIDSIFLDQLKIENTSFARINLIRTNIDSFITRK